MAITVDTFLESIKPTIVLQCKKIEHRAIIIAESYAELLNKPLTIKHIDTDSINIEYDGITLYKEENNHNSVLTIIKKETQANVQR